jgi:uncharacterized protein
MMPALKSGDHYSKIERSLIIGNGMPTRRIESSSKEKLNSVVYFEIPVDEIDRAQEFYTRAFGWSMRRMEELDYIAIITSSTEDGLTAKRGSINGGMQKRSNGVEHPVITIRVEDIDSTLAKIEELGGEQFISKMKVSDMGFTAYFKDTEGNILGLWQDSV